MKYNTNSSKDELFKKAIELLGKCIQSLLTTMMNFVSFPKLLKQIAEKHGELQIESFHKMFNDMIFTYVYQEKILLTAKSISSSNIVQQFENMTKLRRRGFPVVQGRCFKCETPIDTKNPIDIGIYPCGHIYHLSCVKPDASCYTCMYTETSNLIKIL